jgi:hypothetical protein
MYSGGVVLGSSVAVTMGEELPLILGFRKMRVCGGTGCLSWGTGFRPEMMDESGGGSRRR